MQANRFSIEQVQGFWDSVAAEYDRINQKLHWTHTERFETMSHYLPLGENIRILNVWSRTGNAIPFIRQKCPHARITNLEASARMIEIAAKRYPSEIFAQTNLHDLPYENESRDVIVSLETLEHVPDPLHFLLECHRVLRVGGTLILSTPPSWAEVPLRVYEHFFENHGEGPHRFRSVSEILRTLHNVGFTVSEHRGTVLCPVGPEGLKKFCEWWQKNFLRHIGFNRLGIRHFFVVLKLKARDPIWNRIHEEIIRPGISMHSGTCIGLSGGTLELSDPDGMCLPHYTGKGPVPAICYDAMPETHCSYPLMTESFFGTKGPAKSPLLGEYRRILIAHATDESMRRNGASGGIITATLLHLFEKKVIEGAVVLTMDPEHPCRAIPIIARTREEVLASAQSKYVLSPVNTILSRLQNEEGPLAYVGLPHQVFAIRKLQALGHPSVRSIAFVLGPFYGNELYGTAVDSFLRKFGAKREDVAHLSYRAGEWPGYMEAELLDGRVLRMPKFHANYLIPFHIAESSLLSHDLTNEFTDISGGDAWAPVYEERGKGFSLLITRTEKGDTLIREMENSGEIACQEITEEEAIRMQSHGLDFKKRGTFLRLQFKERKGKRIPQYGLQIGNISVSRLLFEYTLSIIFTICKHPLSRWIADRTPHIVIGTAFVWARKLWKASTRNVKHTGLRAITLEEKYTEY